MKFLNNIVLLVIFILFSACPRQDIKPDERKESLINTTTTGTTTVAGNNTIAGTNTLTGNNTTVGTNTSLGVNTTLGTNTLTGNNTVIGVTTIPSEVVDIQLNDTIYLNTKKKNTFLFRI
ncbi:MAG: hypothetical protein SFY32_07295 [Bacteroidota bacterium]|nr:hypothetical protein [Bacteroidota bacterium]